MSSFVLKIIAVLSMTIDHIGYALLPKIAILRVIGRIAMPIFAFQIAIGFKYTKSREKYILRLLLFAIVSQIPFHLLASINAEQFRLNIGFTFLLATLILYSIEEVKQNDWKALCLISIFTIAFLLNYDYYLYGIALVIIFYYTYDNLKIGFPLFYTATLLYCVYRKSLLQIYSLFDMIPILMYNGKKGANIKYFFYAFYPIHMIIIYLIFKLYA